MNFFEYVDKGGVIVYILIFLNIVGFTIIIWKFLVLFKKNLLILQIKENLDRTKPLEAQIEYETKKLESGLTVIKNIAIISPLLGLLGTVVGIYILFDQITLKGLGDPTIFSGGIAIALITTVAGIMVSIPHQIAYNHFISAIDTIEVKAKKELVGHI
ncbi:MotA/TolQ/ExbB proton channel family protein [Aliarcobacter butzleri]|uniref:MotA/TolQ/ExbB proton channel family protein n=1 Tax=Aliarcobacter butzleri TaxID=28197 RepID=UPI00102D811E|nr:MotA/TolQ/ExbB proton channel family protein [Aliarcobacter butzleri]RZV15988.1 MotA/TolQ/ExbB proton channel family protein [Aliarcobacter butzleri]